MRNGLILPKSFMSEVKKREAKESKDRQSLCSAAVMECLEFCQEQGFRLTPIMNPTGSPTLYTTAMTLVEMTEAELAAHAETKKMAAEPCKACQAAGGEPCKSAECRGRFPEPKPAPTAPPTQA